MDGKRLGMIYDLELDLESGKIAAIIVPGSGGVLDFSATAVTMKTGKQCKN